MTNDAALRELSDAECDEIYYARAHELSVIGTGRSATGVERDRDLIRWAYRAGAARVGMDSGRLSWLDRDDIGIECGLMTETGEPTVEIFSTKTGDLIGKGPNIRAAIDAAREQPQNTEAYTSGGNPSGPTDSERA